MERFLLYFKCIAVGFITAFIVLIYRISLEKINFFKKIFIDSFKESSTISMWIILLLFIVIGTLFLGYILKKYPTTRGGGISFVTDAVNKDVPFSSSNKIIIKSIIFKLLGALIALIAGMSFGIESPSIELGGETGQMVGNATKSISEEKKFLVTSGASAGLAAAFGVPFAGMTFAFEQIINRSSLSVIMVIFISTTIAGQSVKLYFGKEPFFNILISNPLEFRKYYLIVIFAFILAVLGKVFFKLTERFRNIHKKFDFPEILKPIFPITLGIFVSFFMIEITGEGYNLIDQMIGGDTVLSYLIPLFLIKFIYFIYCFSTAIPGGSFVPLISLGAVAGKLYAMILIRFFNASSDLIPFFIILGMSLFLIAILRTPITGVILIIELTGNSELFFPLAIGSIFTMLFVESFRMDPLYDSPITQYTKNMPK